MPPMPPMSGIAGHSKAGTEEYSATLLLRHIVCDDSLVGRKEADQQRILHFGVQCVSP